MTASSRLWHCDEMRFSLPIVLLGIIGVVLLLAACFDRGGGGNGGGESKNLNEGQAIALAKGYLDVLNQPTTTQEDVCKNECTSVRVTCRGTDFDKSPPICTYLGQVWKKGAKNKELYTKTVQDCETKCSLEDVTKPAPCTPPVTGGTWNASYRNVSDNWLVENVGNSRGFKHTWTVDDDTQVVVSGQLPC